LYASGARQTNDLVPAEANFSAPTGKISTSEVECIAEFDQQFVMPSIRTASMAVMQVVILKASSVVTASRQFVCQISCLQTGNKERKKVLGSPINRLRSTGNGHQGRTTIGNVD
jgi:hypothetical protein